MELKINVDELKKCKLFIATPMYGGQCFGLYAKAALDLQTQMMKYGIETKFSFLFNESLITRARNYLADEFLRSGYTHLMFIDADVQFNPQDIIALLALDKDIVGGPYPKKSMNWKNIAETARKHPDMDVKNLNKVVGEYVFNVVKGTKQFTVTDPIEVMEIGTGHMMIKRQVFEKMKEEFPLIRYKPDHVGQEHFDGKNYIHAFFDTIIDTKDSYTGGGTDRYLSEDYMFCQMWRKTGGKIWLCPWMKTHHIGTYAFTGDMGAVAKYTGKL
jgi:hypothetical protein|tara:strand:- start:3032 stop:3847 length:816 start_codon:yes stop_codon:yes gene_type:complete